MKKHELSASLTQTRHYLDHGSEMPHPRQRLLGLLLFAGLLATLKFTYWYHLSQGFDKLSPLAHRQLGEVVNMVNGALMRYESIPQVLATNPLLNNALQHSSDSKEVANLNRYLEEIQHVTEAADIYLLDNSGTAIAASNWHKPYSFVGQNYAFRPYYQVAVAGQLGRYYGVGTASDARGFYFSFPVVEQGKVFGIIVVKVDIATIETQLTGLAASGQYELAICGDDGVIFVASMPQWRLKALHPIDPSQLQQIYQSRRYGNRIITPLESNAETLGEYHGLTLYRLAREQESERFIDSSAPMEKPAWHVHLLTPVAPLYQSLPPLLLLSTCIYLLVVLALLFSLERRKHMQRLQQSQQLLEYRVKERTQALQDANAQLQETQDELVQAAKLTVIGSLSASINHEINQPLAALRSYAQNTQTLLNRGMADKAQENLSTIISLADRLAQIVAQFKSFTRKSHRQDSATDICDTVNDALTIVKPELEKQQVDLQLQLPEQPLLFMGDKLRLQQVLVNIISNAITAMEHSALKKMTLSVSSDEKLCIRIHDSGPGVNESHMEKIFEPYFTTSQRHGLGLGLSISRRIVESMNGSISVSNATAGGAIFTILLPGWPVEETQ